MNSLKALVYTAMDIGRCITADINEAPLYARIWYPPAEELSRCNQITINREKKKCQKAVEKQRTVKG